MANEDTLIFLPLYMVDLKSHYLADLLPGIIHILINNNTVFFNKEVDELCDMIPDSDTVISEEDNLRKECDYCKDLLLVRLRQSMDDHTLSVLTTLLQSHDVEVDIVNKTEILIRVYNG